MVRILTACLFLQFVSTLGTPTRGKFKAEYRQKLGENPEGVALTVRLERGRNLSSPPNPEVGTPESLS